MARGRFRFVSVLCVLGALIPSQVVAQQAWLGDWALQKQDELQSVGASAIPLAEFGEPVLIDLARRPAKRITAAETERNARTIALYGSLIGSNSPVSTIWTGVETANPRTRRETYRWSSLEDQGLFDAGRRAAMTDGLEKLGVTNVRIGMANHEIDLDRPASWARHDAFVADLASAGLNLSLDMHHFGVEDRFRAVLGGDETDHAQSYYLHPDWPDYFARFSGEAYRRYGGALKAVTIINEPETTVGFNSEMWHGAYPGWGDPRHARVYIERAFAIGEAAVKARMAIETVAGAIGRRPFFMHTEAAVYKPGAPDFNRIVRFLPSDLILGHDWLTAADPDALAGASLKDLRIRARRADPTRRGTIEWLLETYVFDTRDAAVQAESRGKLVAMIAKLKGLHEALKREHGVAMSDDTVFAADYYAHNEDKGASGAWLSPEPQLYAAQMTSGERRGLYPVIHDYFDRYRLPMMIGETGTPFYAYGARWHAQMLLEVAAAMGDGVPMLGYTIYPLVDTYGWETALSVPKSHAKVNTGGIMDLDLEARPFMRALLDTLNRESAQSVKVDAEELEQVQ